MTQIAIEQVPVDLDEATREFLNRMQININIALAQSDKVQRFNALPDRPEIGRIYFFNDAVLPEIPAEGYYGYNSSGYVRLDNTV